jgi:hypothetical protein
MVWMMLLAALVTPVLPITARVLAGSGEGSGITSTRMSDGW